MRRAGDIPRIRQGVIQRGGIIGTASKLRAIVLGLALIPAGACAGAGAELPVDLELALGVDVSGSIDAEEARLQREGYIAAFRHPSLIRAIRAGILGQIAVAYFEWAGFGHMKVIAGWTIIGDKAGADGFAARLTGEPPETASRTAISDAIDFVVPFFDRNGFQGTRRVFDVSGDGPNNWGDLVTDSRDRAVASGITINGLPIMNDRPTRGGWPPMPNLDLYYRNCVIGGPGAFMVVANNFRDFATAVRRKLILEIAGIAPLGAPPIARNGGGHGTRIAQSRPGSPGVRIAPPCDEGERRSLQRFLDTSDQWPIYREEDEQETGQPDRR